MANTLLSAGAYLPGVVTEDRISLEGNSITDDEERYLQALCDGPKHPRDVDLEEQCGVTTPIETRVAGSESAPGRITDYFIARTDYQLL